MLAQTLPRQQNSTRTHDPTRTLSEYQRLRSVAHKIIHQYPCGNVSLLLSRRLSRLRSVLASYPCITSHSSRTNCPRVRLTVMSMALNFQIWRKIVCVDRNFGKMLVSVDVPTDATTVFLNPKVQCAAQNYRTSFGMYPKVVSHHKYIH